MLRAVTRVLLVIVWFTAHAHAEVVVNATGADTQAWSVLRSGKDSGQTASCTLRSRARSVFDGYTETDVYLALQGDALKTFTTSNLDTGYPGLGLLVDGDRVSALDRVETGTVAVFEQELASIVERFVDGRSAVVALGFWPTWPMTETVTAEFSLIGFTQAYRQYLKCLES